MKGEIVNEIDFYIVINWEDNGASDCEDDDEE